MSSLFYTKTTVFVYFLERTAGEVLKKLIRECSLGIPSATSEELLRNFVINVALVLDEDCVGAVDTTFY